MRSRPPLLYDDDTDDITSHACTECVLKKNKSKQPKNTLFDRERLLSMVCTCPTLAMVLVFICSYFLSISASDYAYEAAAVHPGM